MTLDTNTNVEEMRQVQDGDGDTVPPANENEQQRIAEAVENEDGLSAFEHATSGTTPEPLPSNPVPEGIEVLVTYAVGNGDVVYVGDSGTQPVPLTDVGLGVTLNVTNTDQIYIQTPTAGDSVAVLFEDGGA
jgi:hypothetical protein